MIKLENLVNKRCFNFFFVKIDFLDERKKELQPHQIAEYEGTPFQGTQFRNAVPFGMEWQERRSLN